MSDERQQSMAVLFGLTIISLWASHYIADWFQFAPGTIDLQHGLRFWNKPIIVNWPFAAAFFVISYIVIKQIQKTLNKQKTKTSSKKKSKWDEYLPIE